MADHARATLPRADTGHHRRPRRVPRAQQLLAQVTYAQREFWRSPVVAFVTLGFPLVFLFMFGIAVADAPADPATGAAAIQPVVPITAVFAAVMAAFVMLPQGIARARERGVLKRLRGTPLSTGAYLTGRFANALLVALMGTALMAVNAVTAFHFEVPVGRLGSVAAIFVVGVVCFAALGVAAAVLLRTSTAVMAFTTGSFFLLAFASGSFTPDVQLPPVLDTSTWVFPLRHFSAGLDQAFTPTAGALPLDHLAVLLVWAVAGALVGRWRWNVDPADSSNRRRVAGEMPGATVAGRQPGVVGALGLCARQVRHANRQVWRDPASAFFAVAFPVLFTVLVPYAFGNPVIEGVPFAAMVTPAMVVFAIAVTAYINMPETVAIERSTGVFKRLRGTPLPAWAYLAGRLGSVLWIGALTGVAVLAAGWIVHDVAVPATAWLPLATTVVVGVLALASLGLAIATVVPDAKAAPAVSLGTFIPLAFVSDLLAFGVELPDSLSRIGWVFPFRHLLEAIHAAETAIAVDHLAVVTAWGVIGALIALWRFDWRH